MIRYLSAALAAVGLSFAAAGCGTTVDANNSGAGAKGDDKGKPGEAKAGAEGAGGWGTIKGRIVWSGAKLPKQAEVKVTVDKDHCLAKGVLLDNLFEVNPKNKGFKNVFVALKPPPDETLPVHPKLKDPPKEPVVVDQPRCLFIPRALAVREGQEILAKNSSPVVHNIRWAGDPDLNPGGNITLPAGKSLVIKNLKAQPLPLIVGCNIHPWMSGRLAVYDHPYFAVTDADGNFEIKLAPAGARRLTAYHEGLGWRGGAKGKAGQEITVKAGGVTDLGDLPMGK
jgi:hypothetical protein